VIQLIWQQIILVAFFYFIKAFKRQLTTGFQLAGRGREKQKAFGRGNS